MPSLNDALGNDLSGYKPMDPVATPLMPVPALFHPGRNTFLRSPLPPIWQTTTDSLRQFTNTGMVPQSRIFTAPVDTSSSTGKTTINQYLSSVSVASGALVSTAAPVSGTVPAAAVNQGAVITGVLTPGAAYLGVLKCARAFQLLNLSATGQCRVRLYGTASAQAIDLSRGLDVSPPAGSLQNLICDVVLDTSPYAWSFQNRNGANADNPTSALVYATVTNLSVASLSVAITVSFLTLAS